MRPRRGPILVTGATGCIGGRLVERLMLDRKAAVRTLVRTPARAIRLARFDVEIARGDIASPADIRRAVDGCSVVVHCAYDWEHPATNLAAAEALIDACIEQRVRRVVHVSSLSVYEPLPDGELGESAPRVPCGWEYPDTKLAVELAFERAHRERGLSVVTVEPTVVYGPYSDPWTHRPIQLLRATRLVLPDDGEGFCNAVYVDDVVDSLVLATESSGAVGQRFLISGADHVTWRQFFEAYEDMIGVTSLTFRPAAELDDSGQRDPRSVRRAWSRTRRDPRALLRGRLAKKAVATARPLVGPRLIAAAKDRVPRPFRWPTEQELALYRARTSVSIAQARGVLGYDPRVSFDAGMALTRDFVAWAGL